MNLLPHVPFDTHTHAAPARFGGCEASLTRFCRHCDRGVMFSLAFYMLMPVARTAYIVLLTDTATAATYRALYYDKYYFVDMSGSAVLLGTSTLLASWATFVNATAFVAVPQLFGSLCVYVRTMYDELFGQLALVDAADERPRGGRTPAVLLRRAIRYHAVILE